MRVSRERAAARREQIVGIASELFRQHGFDGVTIPDVMQAAGVTHGGFYRHFESKDHLASEACARANQRNRWDHCLEGPVEGRLERVIRGYLSERHRDAPARGCLLAAVATDVTRQTRSIRSVFTSGVRAKVDILLSIMPGRSAAAQRKKAIATLSGMVGALLLARAVNDADFSAEILSAAADELVNIARV